jgi:hypothetical protein
MLTNLTWGRSDGAGTRMVDSLEFQSMSLQQDPTAVTCSDGWTGSVGAAPDHVPP